jgi:hypothetical protein
MINFLVCIALAAAQATAAPPAERSSPWLVVPVVSSNPKLGTAFGGMGAYLHKFDADSQVSLFGVTYQYTTTDSSIAAAFARTSWARTTTASSLSRPLATSRTNTRTTSELAAAQDQRRHACVCGAISLSREGRLVHRRARDRGELSGAWRVRQDDLALETLGIRDSSRQRWARSRCATHATTRTCRRRAGI